MPNYFSEYGTYDTYTNNPTNGNTRSKRLHSVAQDMDKGLVEDVELGIDHEGRVYGMANVRGKESREVNPLGMHRTGSVRTGVSENATQPYTSPAEPFDVLNQRQ